MALAAFCTLLARSCRSGSSGKEEVMRSQSQKVWWAIFKLRIGVRAAEKCAERLRRDLVTLEAAARRIPGRESSTQARDGTDGREPSDLPPGASAHDFAGGTMSDGGRLPVPDTDGPESQGGAGA